MADEPFMGVPGRRMGDSGHSMKQEGFALET